MSSVNSSAVDESDSEISESDCWISNHCNKKEWLNLFCEIPKSFIEDNFNLYGLRQYFHGDEYTIALHTLLDKIEPVPDLWFNADLLYGLIHQRFILTPHGLELMKIKYLNGDFGFCPRAFCHNQLVIPTGLSNTPFVANTVYYCPRCKDVYFRDPKCSVVDVQNEGSIKIDSCFFGVSFAPMFFMTFKDLVPLSPHIPHIPRVFGYKIHSSAYEEPPKALPEESFWSDYRSDSSVDKLKKTNGNGAMVVKPVDKVVTKVVYTDPLPQETSAEKANETGEKRKFEEIS